MHFPKKSRASGVRRALKSVVDAFIYCESKLHLKNAPLPNGKKCILILRKDGLGDCIIFYPTLAAYREYYKGDKITLVFPKVFETLSPLLDAVDNIIWFDAKKFSHNLLYRRRFLLDLRKKNYDVAIYPVFSREQIGDLMIKMTSTKETIGFGSKDDSSFSKTITPPKDMRLEIDRDRYFAESITDKKIDIAFPTIDIEKLPKDRSYELIIKYSLNERPFVIVFPGAGESYKIWQPQKFASIIDYLADKGITPVVCGNETERKLVKEILSYSKLADKAVDLGGQTDLPTLAHLLVRSKFYFGSDTGILHLAVALGIPSVALTWEGSLGRFFPYGDLSQNVVICTRSSSNETLMAGDKPLLKLNELHPSIKDISVEQVITEIKKMKSALGTYINNHE